jgi:hypothetical protein
LRAIAASSTDHETTEGIENTTSLFGYWSSRPSTQDSNDTLEYEFIPSIVSAVMVNIFRWEGILFTPRSISIRLIHNSNVYDTPIFDIPQGSQANLFSLRGRGVFCSRMIILLHGKTREQFAHTGEYFVCVERVGLFAVPIMNFE